MDSTIPLKFYSEGKTETNQCKIFCLIWLDANACVDNDRETEQKLRSIINYLKKFQDVKSCQRYIEESSDTDRIVLIASGQLGREIVPFIHARRQVTSIYIFCYDKKEHRKWASGHFKVDEPLQIHFSIFY